MKRYQFRGQSHHLGCSYCGGGGLVVSVYTFNNDNPSSNPAQKKKINLKGSTEESTEEMGSLDWLNARSIVHLLLMYKIR